MAPSNKKPGNHQSPTNIYDDRNIVLQNSQGANDMEFEVDSNDNGNVDMDADD